MLVSRLFASEVVIGQFCYNCEPIGAARQPRPGKGFTYNVYACIKM